MNKLLSIEELKEILSNNTKEIANSIILSYDLRVLPHEILDEIEILSNSFSSDFKKKFYDSKLTMDDLCQLNNNQIEELQDKKLEHHMKYGYFNTIMITWIDLKKVIEIYKNKEVYEVLSEILNENFLQRINFNYKDDIKDLANKLLNIEVSKIKKIVFDYVRNMIINSNKILILNTFPDEFIKENTDLFLIDDDIPNDVVARYYKRQLTSKDLIHYFDIFNRIPIDNFMEGTYTFFKIRDAYGIGSFQKLVEKYPNFFRYLVNKNEVYDFVSNFKNNSAMSIEDDFISTVKKYFAKEGIKAGNYSNPKLEFVPPEYLKDINFNYVKRLNSIEDLKKYDKYTFILNDQEQLMTIEKLGIDNIIKLENEINFFSHDDNLIMLKKIGKIFEGPWINLASSNIDFKDGTLPYEKFKDEFAKLLNLLRKKKYFSEDLNYDFIEGEFRDKYKNIFIDKSAPKELKDAYYYNDYILKILYKHKEYLSYIIDNNVNDIVDIRINLEFITYDQLEKVSKIDADFFDEYIKRFGKEKLWGLIIKYGEYLNHLSIQIDKKAFDDEDAVEKTIRDYIYGNIIEEKRTDYSYLKRVPEFVNEHPELFLDLSNISNLTLDQKERLENKFYEGNLLFDDIASHPELVDILKEKEFKICFKFLFKEKFYLNSKHGLPQQIYPYYKIYERYGKENFLRLALKYGTYFNDIIQDLFKEVYIQYDRLFNKKTSTMLSFEDLDKKLEEVLIDNCLNGNVRYNPETAPEFLKERHPELFLSDDAPEELKRHFYSIGPNKMEFSDLKIHKEWLPYLKDKSIESSLLHGIEKPGRKEMKKFFDLFGNNSLRLGINKSETVMEMIMINKVDKMKEWYDRTGCKFIPDYVVMQNFNIEEADKFLSGGNYWSHLMQIKDFRENPDARDAMLKLAYIFGVFDNDQRGYKKLEEILTNIPKKTIFISDIKIWLDDYIYDEDFSIDNIIQTIEKYNKKTFEHQICSKDDLLDLLYALKEENLNIDLSKEIMEQIYKENDDDTRYLVFNPQSYPKTTRAIRKILINDDHFNILSPEKAHQLFGAIKLEYNPEFRDFLLDNLDQLSLDDKYRKFIPPLQRQFKEIKRANSNRKLTLDLAVSYLEQNKYTNIEDGNHKVAEISAIAGYDQEDFEILQRIYNYGKRRIFSSIPRVEGSNENYAYEILRLDDPLAMAIGTLTDCCQEIGNVAEVCMEHSMVDKNGRVFVVRDKDGNIVSQSWVWRNKNVLCFDNIEIPNKAFKRFGSNNPNLGRREFAEEIYNIYKNASHELIEKDAEAYKKLLEENKITQEQYEGLKLSKITVGLGYNDIAEAIKRNAIIDKKVSRPLYFNPPVDLDRPLYTSDSTTQYILEENNKKESYNGNTLQIHSDLFEIYDINNINKLDLVLLEKLELLSKEDDFNIYYDKLNSNKLIEEIAEINNFKPDKTKIIMNSIFAIIYEENENKINIGDIFYITNAGIMQIRLAIEQIKANKEIDISNLDEEQKEIYNKAMSLGEELEIEKGLKHTK